MLDSAPVPGTTSYLSLWYHNLVGILAEWFIYWQPRTTAAAAAAVVTGAIYP